MCWHGKLQTVLLEHEGPTVVRARAELASWPQVAGNPKDEEVKPQENEVAKKKKKKARQAESSQEEDRFQKVTDSGSAMPRKTVARQIERPGNNTKSQNFCGVGFCGVGRRLFVARVS